MNRAEVYYLELAKRFAAVAGQFSQAFVQAHTRLDMGAILTPARLSNSEGTRLSLLALAEMKKLNHSHQASYHKFLLSYAKEMSAAMEALPASIAGAYRQAMTSQVNHELHMQNQFQHAREHWIEAAEAICQLIESRRTSCVFSEAGIHFPKKEDRQGFSDLLAIIKDSYRIEKAIAEARRQHSLDEFTPSHAA
ncbi:MAG: hypothetical protein LWW81_00835 [Rhodocyclales bacterium]|nr:hypothetical protein [Rhodocyclales bacterium]